MSAHVPEQRTTARAAAAYWLNHRRSGDMTADDSKAFRAWLSADPANEAAYGELERVWGDLGALAEDPRLLDVRSVGPRRFHAGRLAPWGALAASVLVLAGGAGLTGVLNRSPLMPSAAVQGPLTFGESPAEFQTSVGQKTTVTLPDHSVVTLDTDTILRVHNKPGERLVSLERGRAYFKVAKDPTRPFIVAAGGHRVRAVGTEFDVRVGPRQFEVTLIEGKVKVETPSLLRPTATTAQLTPGQRLDIAGNRPQLSQVDVRSETTWHEGRLTFSRDSLAAAVAEMNRYSDKKIVFRGGETPDRSIVGVFRAGDVDSFARALSMNGIADITAVTENRIELTAN